MKRLMSAITRRRSDCSNYILTGLHLSTLARCSVLRTPLLGSSWSYFFTRPRQVGVEEAVLQLPIIYRIKFRISVLTYLAGTHTVRHTRVRFYRLSATIPSVNGSSYLTAPTTTYYARTLSVLSQRTVALKHFARISEKLTILTCALTSFYHIRQVNGVKLADIMFSLLSVCLSVCLCVCARALSPVFNSVCPSHNAPARPTSDTQNDKSNKILLVDICTL